MKTFIEIRTLGDCAQFLSGGTPSKGNADYWQGDIPWVSCKDMKVPRLYDTEDHLSEDGSRNGTRLVPAESILIVVRGMILAKEFPVAMAMREVAFNQDLKALRCKDGVYSWFLYYWLLANSFEIRGLADEAAHGTKRLQSDRLLALEVRLPPLETQRKIASILSAYDDLIENNTRRIKILEEMARMVYREWFVNFRFPGHEQVKMVDSPLGKIPEGWEVRTVQDYVELCYGKALKAEDRKEGPYPVYGSSGVVGYHYKHLVASPGIIVGRKGNVGSVHWSDEPFFPIDTVYYVKTDVSLYYVYYNLQHQNFINNDAAVPGLNRNQAYALSFVLPSEQQLRAFDEFVVLLFKAVRSLSKKNQNLRQTRDLLLPKLISGEVAV